MSESFRSPASLARFFLTALIGVGLDLWTKWLAFQKLAFTFPGPDGQSRIFSKPPHEFIPGWLEFIAVQNFGAVFGFGKGNRITFIIVSFIAIAFLIFLFSTSGRKWLYQITLGMLLAGVMGNLYDRLTLGYVRDMIHVFPRWPDLFKYVFNIADSLLCVGVAAMILFSLAPAEAEEKSHGRTA